MQRSILPATPSAPRLRLRLAAPQRTAALLVRAEAHEGTTKVRGKIAPVFSYIANVENMRAWYPGVVAASRVGNTAVPIERAARFQLTRQLLTFSFPTDVQIVEFNAPRKLVLVCDSETYSSTEQFIFMAVRTSAFSPAFLRRLRCKLIYWSRRLEVDKHL